MPAAKWHCGLEGAIAVSSEDTKLVAACAPCYSPLAKSAILSPLKSPTAMPTGAPRRQVGQPFLERAIAISKQHLAATEGINQIVSLRSSRAFRLP
jgi:hypothetical protein